jgi:hypothetical protein
MSLQGCSDRTIWKTEMCYVCKDQKRFRLIKSSVMLRSKKLEIRKKNVKTVKEPMKTHTDYHEMDLSKG